ncbi:GH3 family domain-containing protein [Lutibacter maritimus]|uniref:GH3 auxin-responsive promoter n=1 Tax=Lutibacter maritimus TaxID=593133 RepID=A0A1I6R5C0_9FLAO|nr:GH3 auxin-responsive promoter family protein [Lutibacter maritimus]SFS59897.1 GH3 auxin-responsive promoter [Lutibacter maritimus]
MAILGNIIKGIIEVTDKLKSETNPINAQHEVLKNLLEQAKDTEFGKYYNFSNILKSEDLMANFAKNIPYFDYNKMNSEWWYKLHKGKEDITWPGTPNYFALSSGTTGKKSKRIPVTEAMLEAIQQTGIKQVLALTNFNLPTNFFEKEIMMLGSSTELKEKNNHLEGEISGISASNIPFWFRPYYKPGKEIAEIDDWDTRVHKIAKNAKNWDIGALSGIPSWIELMLQEVINYHKVKNIHEIWPNLQVYTSGGVAFDSYEKSFNALLGKPITIIDTYLASEGFLAFQTRPETSAMQLITDTGIYFEFVPFKPEYIKEDGSLTENAEVKTLAEVELQQEYVLIISTVAGAWRYLIGDTIEFTDVERAEIKITGRTKFFLNVVGSQLSVNKMTDAVKELENYFKIKITEFTLSAKRINGEYNHVWYLGTENTKLNCEEIAEKLDEKLKKANKNYKVARSKALKRVLVTLIKPHVFHDWNDYNKKKGGQVKMERVMGEEKFALWEKFVKENEKE